jgi:hypothetical protein
LGLLGFGAVVLTFQRRKPDEKNKR